MTIRFKDDFNDFKKGCHFKSKPEEEKYFVDLGVAEYINSILCIGSLRFPFS